MIMCIRFWLIGILVASQSLAHEGSHHVHPAHGSSTEPFFLVTGYDFENTNVEKVCMLALIDASINLRNTFTDSLYTVRIPSDSSTEGSYCNRAFKSVLVLKFAENVVQISFSRTHDMAPHHAGVVAYCTDCHYGQWRIDEIAFTIHHNETKFHAVTESETIADNLPPALADGILIRRSFRCRSSDEVMIIPMTVHGVTNLTDGQRMGGEDWIADIDFTSIHLQPFLVGSPTLKRGYAFSDPVLCKNITASHIVVIFLPLTYFALLVAYNYAKEEHGWSIWKKKKKSSNDNEDEKKFITDDVSTAVTVL